VKLAFAAYAQGGEDGTEKITLTGKDEAIARRPEKDDYSKTNYVRTLDGTKFESH